MIWVGFNVYVDCGYSLTIILPTIYCFLDLYFKGNRAAPLNRLTQNTPQNTHSYKSQMVKEI